MDPQLLGQLQQTIRVGARSGVDSAGKGTYSSSAEVSARVEPLTRIVARPDGTSKATTHSIITNTSIGELDRIWLPGIWATSDAASVSTARLPVSVETLVDEFGNVDHYEVLV